MIIIKITPNQLKENYRKDISHSESKNIKDTS